MTTTDTLTEEDLAHFTGSEEYTKFNPFMPNVLLSEGAKYVADKGGAYWLMDLIGSWQHEPRLNCEEFQVWELKVNGTKGVVTCEDGNGNKLCQQAIDHTDFPLASIKFYYCNNVIHLPSEY